LNVLTDNNLSTQQSPSFRFAIAATFTADPLRPTILFWGRELDTRFDVQFAPYNQLLQTLLDPDSQFARNTHGINILLARLEDFGQFQSLDAAALVKIEANVNHFVHELRGAGSRLSSPVLFCLCPSHVDEDFARKMRTRIGAELEDSPGVHCIDYCDIERLYPVAAVHNPQGERLGNIPYTDLYYSALGTMLVRYAHSLLRAPFKVVALDCDNTLWRGICGEDGPEGVVLDPARRVLHECMLEQREAGMLLTMASKNNESDVLETFAVHPEMPLQLRHFVAWRLNWDPKAENVTQLAEELGLGLDSFIFIDDNPKECAELQQATPEVLTLTLPEEIEDTPKFLRHVWAFDHPVITEEDRNRNVYYRQQQEFGSEVKRAASIDEFMASLDLKVSVMPLVFDKLPRVAQLTQRTNQFNLTTIRRSESEIQALIADGYECFTVDVSDRFGDYGLVGVLIVKPKADELQVDTFLLSCRALGRGVEHRMLAFLGQHASSLGLHHISLGFNPTPKNSPAKQFLDSVASGGLRLPTAEAAELKWKRSIVPSVNGLTKSVRISAKVTRKADYEKIARELSTAEAILAEVRQRRTSTLTAVAGMSEVETQLAGIWSELLERGGVSPNDNFFDIGGHSLLAVLLLLRIREAFDVELSIDDVYSGALTLADLAYRIEAAQAGGIDPGEYAALLAEIESMSDEQAREILEREGERA
jgi:FkbH-like protein